MLLMRKDFLRDRILFMFDSDAFERAILSHGLAELVPKFLDEDEDTNDDDMMIVRLSRVIMIICVLIMS